MATWHPLTPNDINAVISIADKIHPDLPESADVFLDRIAFYPDGCLALKVQNNTSTSDQDPNREEAEVVGYAISHPIRRYNLPALNSLLRSEPNQAGSEAAKGEGENRHCYYYYIHDIAILPAYQGKGLAGGCIRQLLGIAERDRYPVTCLVSVYGTERFWGGFGFKRVDGGGDEEGVGAGEKLKEKLEGYGEGAVYLERENRVA
ncbi:hypothetical protein BDV18DRAFT_145040 [Aspergillus unguis]